MQNARPSFAFRLLPSLADFAFLAPVVFLFTRMSGMHTLLADGDTGWHIRTGEWVLTHRAVPAQDIFSYSKAGAPWFAWEWGADVLMAWLNAAGGLRTVAFCALLMICAIFLLLFWMVRQKANPILAVGVTILAAATSSIHWLARPHLFTLLFVALFCAALIQVREGRERLWGVPYLALLPVATLIWTNLHGGFFVGVVLVGLYGAGAALETLRKPGGTLADFRPAGRFLGCAAACLAASLVNPYTYHLHAHMLQFLGDPFTALHIMEYFSPNFHDPASIYLEAMLALAAAAACWHLARGRFIEPLLLLAMGHAALLAGRNIPLFAVAAAVPVAAALEAWLDRLPSLPVAGWLRSAAARYRLMADNAAAAESIVRLPIWSLAGAALVGAVIYAPHPPKSFRAEFDPKSFPSGALTVLERDPQARIFTFDQWGDYLIWNLYPRQKVFVDGRCDFYGDAFVSKVLDVFGVKYDWEETLGSFGVNTVLLPPDAPLAGALKESRRWRVVYDDGRALVFQTSRGREPQA